MIKEAYVSFEVAKLLKEKGFNWDCITYYVDSEPNKVEYSMLFENNTTWEERCYSAPTHQMAMAWLREHCLHINATISYDYSVDADGNEVDRRTFYVFEICSSFTGNLIYTEEINEYDSYEEAVEAALKYCLEKLI